MSKKTILWAVAVMALAATAGMAAGPPPVYNNLNNLAEGQIYLHTDPRPLGEGAVDLPTTASSGTAKSGNATSSKPGPVSIGSDSDIPGRSGGAIVMPRGSGPMYTPQQQADREISRLIRKLG